MRHLLVLVTCVLGGLAGYVGGLEGAFAFTERFIVLGGLFLLFAIAWRQW